ncbi:hypothetical protein FOG51_02847 [Hanseniaspora uvarum]|nr:hypothetical protein FOG51_02847 [Hanseniaspora uvarum]KAF0276200.1 hypothetical protein FOG50_02953 [Hanseniaspora uvarum]
MADWDSSMDLDLEINTDFIDTIESNEQQSLSNDSINFFLEEGTEDVVVILEAIKDFYFKLQKSTNINDDDFYKSYFQTGEIPKWLNKIKQLFNDEARTFAFSDLIELTHISRLLIKFLNNIAINNINKNLKNGSLINLRKIFDIIDDNSLSFTILSQYSTFLIEASTFVDAQKFLDTLKSYVDIDADKENLITLQLIDTVYPFTLNIDFKEPLRELYTNVNDIYNLISIQLHVEFDRNVPNIKELLNSNTNVLLYIFSIVKNIQNLLKMNHKTLANIGKSNNRNESAYLYKNIEAIFPILLDKKPLLNDILYNQVKVKATQRLANKIILLSRVDFHKGSQNGDTGKQYYTEMVQTINNWIENDRPNVNSLANNDLKPLPIPKDNNYVDKKNKKSKKRAGKKLTKYRQRFQHTEVLDKLKNQLEFGKKETFTDGKDQYLDDMEDNGLGMAAERYKKLLSKKIQTKRVNKS